MSNYTAKPFMGKEDTYHFATVWPSGKSAGCPGGGDWVFLGGYVPPGTPNWLPVLKKNSHKIDTPF